jgi:3-oxoadipate enol-lactonase
MWDPQIALLDALQIERTHICGLSLGGVIALWFAATYPDRVLSAVFANTAARIGTEETWNTRIDAVRMGGMAAIREAVVARFLSEGFRQRHPEMTRRMSEMIEATSPIGYIGACAALRDADLREMVSTIDVPSLILAGELDESTPASQARELHAAISNVEKPEEFSQCILALHELV